MIRSLSLVVLSSLLGGCSGSGQNALLGDVLSRAMQETSLSSTDQGLAVRAVQGVAQGTAQRRDTGYTGDTTDAPSQPSTSAEPAAEDAEVW
ncbi:hypothetical protein [Pseudomonas sp. ML96]|uniref:hypothetical protein n=1 Tax=Pseudomonas sp. ML96 TaxID=1523503 RepID=UPI0005BE14E7|nr:hypothetical protein [Pseudomonas sp. ML96]